MMRYCLLATLLAAIVLGAAPARAGFDAKCYYGQEWTKNAKKIEGIESPLSYCQAATLGFGYSINDILVGGTGSAEVIGIPAGSGGGGCQNNDECSRMCQALCCMAPGCKYSSVKKDEKNVNYGVYVETEKYFYCRMHSSGSLKDSDTQSTCTKLGSTYCPNLAYDAFKMDTKTYNYIVSLGPYETCPTKRRSLLAATHGGSFVKPPTKRQIKDKVQATFKPFATLKQQLTKLTPQQLHKKIQASGVCSL